MKTVIVAFVSVLALGCEGAQKIGSDSFTETAGDTTSPDVAGDTLPADTAGDPDVVDVLDATDLPDSVDTSDPPSDPPAEIGAPCETSDQCDDGLFCNGTEYCHPTGVCRRTPAPDCDDGAACTIDFCDETAASCLHEVDSASCDDHDPCTDEGCDTITGTCTHVPVDCADGVTCTLDLCDPLTGACMHTISDLSCDDGDACTIDRCNVAADVCENTLVDADHDGYAPASCGGPDCDDASSGVHPGATDVCGDGVDQDCDGLDGAVGSCDCPVGLTLPGTYTGTTAGAASITQGGCASSSPSPEMVHRLVLADTTTVFMQVSATSIYPILYVRQGSCTGTELDCATYSDPTILLTLGAGAYYVFVEGFSGSYSGAYTLDVRESFVPVPVTGNDTCATAHAISASGSFGGNNTALTDTGRGTCPTTTTGGRDAWFRLTLGGARTVVLDTSGSTYDTVLYVRRSTCDGIEVGCDDDSGTSTASRLSLDLAAGTYYVVVDAYTSTSAGSYLLTVTGL